MINYNPYELVKLVINGTPIDGRPIQFDSEPVNQKTMKNAFGTFVKPSKVATVCPDCGQGLFVDLKLPDPPFPVVQHSCPHCKPPPPPLVDPFINPLESGRVPIAELDPLLHNPDKPLSVEKEVVASRFPFDALPVPCATPGENVGESQDRGPVPQAKPGKVKPGKAKAKPKEEQPKTPPPAYSGDLLDDILDDLSRDDHLEKAEGLDEETDFDDSEMVE